MAIYDVNYEPVGIYHGESECLMATAIKGSYATTDKVWRYKTDDGWEYETEVEADNIKQALDIGFARIMDRINHD